MIARNFIIFFIIYILPVHMKELASQIFTKFIKYSSVKAKSFAIYLQCSVAPLSEPTLSHLSLHKFMCGGKGTLAFCVCFLVPKDTWFYTFSERGEQSLYHTNTKRTFPHRNVSTQKHHVEMIVCGNLFISITCAHWCLWATDLIVVSGLILALALQVQRHPGN